MAHSKAEEQYQVTWLIRRLFRAMAQNTTDRLADLNLTAADRAVLEFLYRNGSLTVPDIASRYQVTRQHVQVTANGLLARKLIRSKSNPAHKRSLLLALTAKGQKLFERIKQNDLEVLDAIFADLKRDEIKITRDTLQTLLAHLQ